MIVLQILLLSGIVFLLYKHMKNLKFTIVSLGITFLLTFSTVISIFITYFNLRKKMTLIKNIEVTQHLINLRDFLLLMLVNGQVSVK